MEKLKVWCGAQFAERKVEPNSGLGKAISYLFNHWEKLTLFLREPGAPLDNKSGRAGIEEIDPASQELAVYKNRNGAQMGDLFMSLIHTCGTQPCQSVRLPHRVAAARRGVEANAVGLDAQELPRDAGADRRPLGCGIGYAESSMAEKDGLWPRYGCAPEIVADCSFADASSSNVIGQQTESRRTAAWVAPRASRSTGDTVYSRKI